MQEVIDTEFTLYTSKGKIDIMKLVFSDGAIRYRLSKNVVPRSSITHCF